MRLSIYNKFDLEHMNTKMEVNLQFKITVKIYSILSCKIQKSVQTESSKRSYTYQKCDQKP